MSQSPIELVLAHLPKHKRRGAHWRGPCPAHHGKNSNLAVSLAEDGSVLLHCHSNGCEPAEIVGSIGLELADLFPARLAQDSTRGTSSGDPEPLGCTLEEYAAKKKLPIDFLKSLGVSEDSRYSAGARTLRIPYFDPQGQEIAVRRRIRMSGDRFRWKTGCKPVLYGLNRIGDARETGYAVLCEGESDVQTLTLHGIPAVGLPGAGNWSEERDAQHFEGIPRIYVVIEPDAGGSQVERWLSRSSIRSRCYLLHLGEFKDPNEMHCDNPATFVERFEQLLPQAIPWEEHESAKLSADAVLAFEECRQLAESPNILERFARDFEAVGHVGEPKAAKVLFLTMISRLLAQPASVVVKGPSSAGKSHLVATVLGFFNPEAAYVLTAMSQMALAYSDEPLKHRMLVIYEAAGIGQDSGQYLMRSLLSEGHLRYETVDKTSQGLRPRLIEREGPTGLILTTTATRLHPENETRMLSITVSDSVAQTRNVLRAIASPPASSTDDILSPWRALDRWISSSPSGVDVPFAIAIAEGVNIVGVRLRRDFQLLITLVHAHAMLHQANRPSSANGRILATLDDYAAVRELMETLVSEGLQASISSFVRETVSAVERLAGPDARAVAGYEVAAALGLDRGAISRRIQDAIDLGYIENRETRKGRPQRLVIVRKLPEDGVVFPTVAAVAATWKEMVINDSMEGPFVDDAGADEALPGAVKPVSDSDAVSS